MSVERLDFVHLGNVPFGDDLRCLPPRSKINAGQHNHFDLGLLSDFEADSEHAVAEADDWRAIDEEHAIKFTGHPRSPGHSTERPKGLPPQVNNPFFFRCSAELTSRRRHSGIQSSCTSRRPGVTGSSGGVCPGVAPDEPPHWRTTG